MKLAFQIGALFWGKFGANRPLKTVLGQFGVSPKSARKRLIRRVLTPDCDIAAEGLS